MKPPHERPMRPNATLYSPAARGKLPSPEWEGQTKNLSVHPSTEPGQLQSNSAVYLGGWLSSHGRSPRPFIHAPILADLNSEQPSQNVAVTLTTTSFIHTWKLDMQAASHPLLQPLEYPPAVFCAYA